MSTAPRKAAPRLARPAAVYRRGQAPKGVVEVDSDSEGEDGQLAEREDDDVPANDDEEEEDDGGELIQAPRMKPAKAVNITLKNFDISRDVQKAAPAPGDDESEESEEESDGEGAKPRVAGAASAESSEYDSESEQELAQPMFRPVFVPKRARVTVQEREQQSVDSEEAIKKREAMEEERRKDSFALAAETIKRELAEKEKEDEQPDLDDTDGIEPTAEFEAWRLRELARIKRDKEEQMRRDEEREEIERRRALPEEQRLKEDLEHAQQSRDAKPKGQQKFLQKYWHKGAFHQDEEILKKHDYTEATESTVDVSMLPKVMQVRDFGKRSRTKYTHLVDQDTTAGNGGFGGAAFMKPGAKVGEPGAGCFLCGGPHLKKDCPQNHGPIIGTGANNSGMAGSSRQWGQDKDRPNRRDSSWRDRDRHRSPGDRVDPPRPREGGRAGFDDGDLPRGPRDYGGMGRDRDSEQRASFERNQGKDSDRRDNYRYRDDDQPRRSRSPRRDRHRDRRHSRDKSPDVEHGGGKRRRVD